MFKLNFQRLFIGNKSDFTPKSLFIFLGITAVIGVVGILFYNTAKIGILSILVYKPVKGYIDDLIRKNRSETLRLQFRDFISCIASSLSTGRHMADGIKEAKLELEKIYNPKDAIMIELDITLTHIESRQMSVTEALRDFARRSEVDDIEMFVHIYEACKRSGGDFVSAIYKISDLICQKIEIEKEIKQIISQRKFESKIITMMPILVLLFLRILSPEYLSIMYIGISGRIAMTIALMGIYMAYRMMERITDIEI